MFPTSRFLFASLTESIITKNLSFCIPYRRFIMKNLSFCILYRRFIMKNPRRWVMPFRLSDRN